MTQRHKFARHALVATASLGALALAMMAHDAAAQTAETAAPQQDAAEVDDIVVTGFRASLQNALNIKRREAGVVDAISAEDIADFPDTNLAESIQRIPGVSIDRDAGEGRSITVRGLSSEFTRTRINGIEAQSSTGATDSSGGVNRGRGFDFNVFASELFNNITVRKTASAEVEEGSLGATVDLQTSRPFDKMGFQGAISGQYGYNDLSQDWSPRFAALVSNTWADDQLAPCSPSLTASATVWKKASARCAGDRLDLTPACRHPTTAGSRTLACCRTRTKSITLASRVMAAWNIAKSGWARPCHCRRVRATARPCSRWICCIPSWIRHAARTSSKLGR